MRRTLVALSLLVSTGALAQPAAPTPPPDPAGAADAPPMLPVEAPPPATPPVAKVEPTPVAVVVVPPPVVVAPAAPADGKLDVTFYGFVELDTIYDSTQGLNDLAGNNAIARPGTYTGEHSQTTFGGRNSRFGLKLAEPLTGSTKVTGQMEMDFLGNQPPGISEAAFWQNPTMRFRHLNVKLETKYIDVLAGQYWQLFGWQGLNAPGVVQIQGVPGQVYSRSPQIRFSHKLHFGDAATLEVAVAASRPPQRASATPDGHAGVKLSFDKLRAAHTAGATGTSIDAAAIGVSVVGRRFAVDELTAAPAKSVKRHGYGLSLDAMLPILPAHGKSRGNALTVQGSFVTGAGIADLYTGLSGNVSQPTVMGFTPNIDNGLVEYRADGTLHAVKWTSELVGVQYYLPPSGRVWVSANASHLHSKNAHLFGDSAKVFDTQTWFDACLFAAATPAARFGIEYARTKQTYVDGVDAIDTRLQLSAFLVF